MKRTATFAFLLLILSAFSAIELDLYYTQFTAFLQTIRNTEYYRTEDNTHEVVYHSDCDGTSKSHDVHDYLTRETSSNGIRNVE